MSAMYLPLLLLLLSFLPSTSSFASVLTRTTTCHAATTFVCGKQIGMQAKSLINTYVETDATVKSIKIYINTESGAAVLASYLEVHTKALPDLVDEVRGLSLGASVPFNLLFAINLQSELLQLITPTHANTGCSDYHISSPTGQAWAHNEDGPKSSLTYMVNSTVAGDNYVAFTYPGQLAGWAWAVTGRGLCTSINALTSAPSTPGVGIGVTFLARSLLDAATVSDAVKLAVHTKNGGGQHFNIGQLGSAKQISVETSALTATSVQNIAPFSHYFHANLYTHDDLNPINGDITSSIHRMARASSRFTQNANPPVVAEDILDVMGDTVDANGFSIYRQNNDVDPEVTHCTVLFDLLESRVSVYTSKTETATSVADAVYAVRNGMVVTVDDDSVAAAEHTHAKGTVVVAESGDRWWLLGAGAVLLVGGGIAAYNKGKRYQQQQYQYNVV